MLPLGGQCAVHGSEADVSRAGTGGRCSQAVLETAIVRRAAALFVSDSPLAEKLVRRAANGEDPAAHLLYSCTGVRAVSAAISAPRCHNGC